MTENSLRTVIVIPVYKTNNGFTNNVNVDNYLRDLQASKLKILPNDEQLIYVSLIKSGENLRYADLSANEKTVVMDCSQLIYRTNAPVWCPKDVCQQ